VDLEDDPLDQFSEIPLNLAGKLQLIENARRPRQPTQLDVRALRERLRLTQRQFALIFGFPVATLRHWERGNRRPTGTALVLLHVIRENPRAVRSAVLKARSNAPDDDVPATWRLSR
jgi:putative transcriptional regulator